MSPMKTQIVVGCVVSKNEKVVLHPKVKGSKTVFCLNRTHIGKFMPSKVTLNAKNHVYILNPSFASDGAFHTADFTFFVDVKVLEASTFRVTIKDSTGDKFLVKRSLVLKRKAIYFGDVT